MTPSTSRRPTPAPAPTPAAPDATLVVAVTPQAKEATEPLNTRVAASVAALARAAAKEHDITLRQVIEAAVLTRWGS
ncbi:hypothetical protein [Plantibacter sp. RU18]|uniref:hypothetical protein n=1 Tax=Plantibacter sp. RU18 TaxID=3158143 RepID=UPI003D369AAD